MKSVKVKLGDKVKCKVTGFTGIVIGKTDYLYGCTRLGVQAKADKDGKIPDTFWCDEPQVDIVKEGVVKRSDNNTGGPMPSTPKQASAPR